MSDYPVAVPPEPPTDDEVAHREPPTLSLRPMGVAALGAGVAATAIASGSYIPLILALALLATALVDIIRYEMSATTWEREYCPCEICVESRA